MRKTLITFTIAMSLGFSSTIANAQDTTTTDLSPVVEAEVTQTEQTTQNTTSDATVTGSDEAKSSSSSQETKPEAPAASEAEAETTSDEGLVAEKPEVDPGSQIKDQLSSSKLSSKDEKSADKDKATKTEDKSEISDNSSSLSSKKDEKKPAGITQTADEANKSQQASSNPALRVAGVIAGIVGVLGLIGGGIFWALQQNLINIPGLPNPFAPKPAPAPAPAPAPQPAPAPAPAQNQPARQAQAQAQPVRHQAPAPAASGKRYKNCRAVWNELGRPIRSNEPGYGRHLDRDGDGVGCERRPR
ncbi:MAG: excalibur calcium-binding domain-containing protein [Corynebacterium matruchotii]|uniref:Sodium pump decarboxylase, gamma subunit n=2 Tax=Corynebacterium matruchotii TaxID=43768 RepID=E0DEL7_9CORY|nr:excalibur calcium-binding domain-containing protein [Corynebacterium matruchotii]EFM49518.1 sodium pump decarboxylase, gamma subunit [Corynebacterium matruchotii ATCC 14266]SPW28644.1 Metallo-beta-lactamase superfamily hydrolase [Corynebacterium matruchotii]